METIKLQQLQLVQQHNTNLLHRLIRSYIYDKTDFEDKANNTLSLMNETVNKFLTAYSDEQKQDILYKNQMLVDNICSYLNVGNVSSAFSVTDQAIYANILQKQFA